MKVFYLLYLNGKQAVKARLKKKDKKDDLLTNPYLPRAEDQMEDASESHPSRPRKKYRGELIQMDASSFV